MNNAQIKQFDTHTRTSHLIFHWVVMALVFVILYFSLFCLIASPFLSRGFHLKFEWDALTYEFFFYDDADLLQIVNDTAYYDMWNYILLYSLSAVYIAFVLVLPIVKICIINKRIVKRAKSDVVFERIKYAELTG